jgi:hypothetical protein
MDILQMSEKDHIGVVRAHRWASSDLQRKRLKLDGVRTIVELDGKKDAATRDELERLTRPTTTIKIVHAFLLADPKQRRKRGGMKADFLAYLKRLTCQPPKGRGGTVKDVDTGLSTDDPGHKQAIIALAYAMLARDGKGLKSKLNGAKSTNGRPPKEFSDEVKAKAEVYWFDKRLKTWDDVKAKLKPLGVSVDRAYEWFGKRNRD